MPTSWTSREGTDRGSRPLSAVPAPRDPTAACEWEIDTHNGPAGKILVLRVVGEIDLLTVPQVRAALATAVARAPTDLVVDLAGVRFCCVRGFALFADTAHTTTAGGVGYAVSGLSRHLDRIADMLWCDQHLARYASTAAAVTALRIDQAHRLG